MEYTAELDGQVEFYKSLCFSENTKKAYSVHKRTYLAFCKTIGVAPVPADTKLLCRYAVFLSRKLKYTSIKQYLNIVRLLHKQWGLPNPCEENFHLTATLRGIRRHLGDTVNRKKPITPGLMCVILNALDLNTPRGASVWAACVLMFFGLLRRSNVMVTKAGAFDPSRHLRRRDLAFTKEGLKVCIRWTKTIQYQERVFTIPYPWKRGHKLCPTQGVYQAVRLTPLAAPDGPALVCSNSTHPMPLTTDMFMMDLRRALQSPDRDTSQYAGHSFRRGGSCHAFDQHIDIETIRQLGDWRSMAYTSYVLPSGKGLAAATAVMLDSIPH